MKNLAIFNCSNDMALAANVSPYFPPKRIQQMEDDLAELSQIWASDTIFYKSPLGQPRPWGWSLGTKARFRQMGISEDSLPSDEWIQGVRDLSSRKFAVDYIHELLHVAEYEGWSAHLIGNNMKFCTELSPENMAFHNHATIYKSPWSSSGRGVFVSDTIDSPTSKRLQGFINSQGGFVSDTFYADKTLDFAMEFFITSEGKAEWLGYSVFAAAEHGAYGYNYVESQEALEMRILSQINNDAELLNRLKTYHANHLCDKLKGKYEGPVGIDMIATADGLIHPCIEINLRMNMGILALMLYSQFGENVYQKLTSSPNHGFEAVINEGKLQIIVKKIVNFAAVFSIF